MNPHCQFVCCQELTIDVQLLIIAHVTDVGDTVFSNLRKRVLCLLNTSFVRERFWNHRGKKSLHTSTTHMTVEPSGGISNELYSFFPASGRLRTCGGGLCPICRVLRVCSGLFWVDRIDSYGAQRGLIRCKLRVIKSTNEHRIIFCNGLDSTHIR